MEDAIKVLEWVVTNKLYIDTHNECDYHDIHKAIENLIEKYKNAKKSYILATKYKEEQYIPKSRVREKIEEAEEYEKEVKTIITVNGTYYIPSSAYYKIIQEGYKELLQEGDDK